MPKTKRVTLTLPEVLIEHLKREASELGIGYQTLIRIKLMEDYKRKAPIRWGKGKPKGAKIKIRSDKPLSEIILEDRR
ncbi:MAG TPA: hypothetical protein ENJ96_08220 [Thermodesulfatator atlanticus]|uniref:Uncharacterized protein n=1 Tax=Thermodesulfatator atlanticus TaxID=501497 RepID=A0A7V5P0X5_9BACT|nr:hypothetical protein [Thermodesulfatator atlanticus]